MRSAVLFFAVLVLVVGPALGAVLVSEPLDVDQWTETEQVQVRDALVAIVGPAETDYTSWSTEALNAEVAKIMAEMSGRDGAVVHYYQGVTVDGHTVIQDPDNLPALQQTKPEGSVTEGST